jgi:DNA-binding transcriptional ArsR family regulator
MSSEEVGEPAGLASMRALAHPTRVAIVKLLEAHPALTATECGNALGFSAKTCSYHLQTLASAGLVTELPGAGRNRPWRLTRAPATTTAPTTADPLRRARERRLAARSRRESDVLGHAVDAVAGAAVDPIWSEAATVYDRAVRMSPDELRAWGEDVERLTRRHLRRAANSAELGDNVHRHPVHLLFYGFPEAALAESAGGLAAPAESAGGLAARAEPGSNAAPAGSDAGADTRA